MARTVVPPRVVGDHRQDVRAVAHELRDQLAIDRLVADGRADAQRFSVHLELESALRCVFPERGVGTAQLDDGFFEEAEDLGERHLLYTRH